MDFKSTIDLFDEYYRQEDKNSNFNRDVASEARKRLIQLDRILRRIIALEKEEGTIGGVPLDVENGEAFFRQRSITGRSRRPRGTAARGDITVWPGPRSPLLGAL